MASISSGPGGQYVEGSLYYYAPNKGAPVVFAFLFLFSFVIHVRQSARYKSWKITLMLPGCALFFGAGYILREVGAFNYDNVNIYIASMTIIYSAPPLYEMCNYQILSRLLYYVPYHSPIHPGRILTTLAGIPTVVETLNGNGVSYWANIKLSQSKQNMGKDFLKASLVTQIVVLLGFVSLTGWFHYKCKKKGPFPKNIRDVIITLYCSSVLVGIRAIYRTVEYYSVTTFIYKPGMDPSSAPPIIRYEAFFWVFEALIMLANSFLWNFHHPMAFLPTDSRIYLAEDGITEVVGPGYEDLRFFIIAMVDPFDLIGLLMGRHKREEFWKTDAIVEEQSGPKAMDEEVGGRQSDVEKRAGLNTEVTGVVAEGNTERVVDTGVKGVDVGQGSEESKNLET
ncbi:hypothetical protein G7Y89_g12762 [Cudoniella acicularis]|uniref:Uncharacterized protein n=1 Tax=Cudoniella acicularis TaxID=354080 RepID=A0A8H4VX24_9HELO|nr:hypothetical protein G7Y89_g12762 [Cudoniella acicularis]